MLRNSRLKQNNLGKTKLEIWDESLCNWKADESPGNIESE